MNNGQQNWSGLSREDLLLLVAVQQNQLRSQQEQQQQEQQQRLALLGQAGSLFAGSSTSQPYGDLSAFLPPTPSDAGSLADILRTHQALNASGLSTRQDPAGNRLADLLQSQGARLPSQFAPTAQDPFGSLRHLMHGGGEQTSVGNHGGQGVDGGPNSLSGNSTSQDLLLRTLFGGGQLLQQSQVQPPPAASATAAGNYEHCPAVSSGPSVAIAAAADPPANEEEEDIAQEEERALASRAGAGRKKAKRPLSAYNIFFKEEHAKIIALNEQQKAERLARGEKEPSDDEYSIEEGTGKKRKRSLSTNQPGKRGKRQVDFENLTKVIGKRWKDLPKERVDEYKRRAEEAMQAYRKNLFQKIRNSVKEDQT